LNGLASPQPSRKACRSTTELRNRWIMTILWFAFVSAILLGEAAAVPQQAAPSASIAIKSPDWPLASMVYESQTIQLTGKSFALQIPDKVTPCEVMFTGVDGIAVKRRLVLWRGRNHAVTLHNLQVCRRIVSAPLGHGDMEAFLGGAFVGADRVISQEEFGDRVVWDRRSGREVIRLSGLQSGAARLPRAITRDAFSTCGRFALIQSGSTVRLVRVDDDTVVSVHDLTEPANLAANADILVDPRTPPFRSLGWAHDSRHFYIQRRDNATFVGDIGTPEKPLRLVDFKDHLSVMAISGDGKFLALNSNERHELRLWDVAQSKIAWSLPYANNRRCRKVYISAQRPVFFVHFVPDDDKTPVGNSEVDQIAEVEISSGRTAKSCDVRNCVEGELFHATENDLLLCCCTSTNRVSTWSFIDTTNQDLIPVARAPATEVEYRVYALSGDGQEVLARPFKIGGEGDLSIVSLETMQAKARLVSHIPGTRSVALSPSGDAISILSSDGVLANWVAGENSWNVVTDGSRERENLCGVLERDGQRYAVLETRTGKESRALEVRDMADGKAIGAWTLPAVRRRRFGVPSIALSRDGMSAAILTNEGNAKVVDVVTGRLLWELSGLVGTATSVCCDPIRTVVYIGHDTGDVESVDWQRKTSTMINHAHLGPVTACAVSGDGTVLLSVGEDQRCHVWNARDGREIHSFALEFVPDEVAVDREGRVAFVSDGDHAVMLRISDGQELRAFDNRVFGIDSINLTQDGSKLVCRCRDQSAVIDLVDGEIACWIFPFRNGREVCVVSDRFGGEGPPDALDACRIRTVIYGRPNVYEDRHIVPTVGLLQGILRLDR
jgi:WD40 repeat protein